MTDKEQAAEQCSSSISSSCFAAAACQQVNRHQGERVTPPVLVADLEHLDKGNGLLATRGVCRGERIWTEYSHVAACIPMPSSSQQQHAGGSSHNIILGPVRACQACLACMEPASTFFDNDDKCNDNHLHLNLWPTPAYTPEFERIFSTEKPIVEATIVDSSSSSLSSSYPSSPTDMACSDKFLQDSCGRVVCRDCHMLFCSRSCQDAFFTQVLPDCCRYRKALDSLLNTAITTQSDDDDDDSLVDYWEIVLAMRLFCGMVTTTTRNRKKMDDDIGNMTALGNALQGMCGDAADVNALRVGLRIVSSTKCNDSPQDDECYYYSVTPFYDAISAVLLAPLTEQEQEYYFSLEYFERLVMICKRNALNVKTKSSFCLYEDRIRQSFGGDDSDDDEFKDIIKKAMMALHQSGHTGKVEQLGQVDCCVLYPLFSKMNHDCDPSVDVIDGLSHDRYSCCCRIDLVATRDISQGEELSVSYLSPDHAASEETQQRIQRLQSSHLFTCRCSRCSSTIN